MKITLSVLFFFFSLFSVNSFDLVDLVEELTNELQSSNEVIMELQSRLEVKQNTIFVLETILAETIQELENSNIVIIDLQNQLKQAQSEITHFREQYERSLQNVHLNSSLGLGVTYPRGVELISTFTPGFLRTFSLYARAGIYDTFSFQGGIGAMFSF